MKKQELSLKQQYQRLTMAKAQATRNGQPTPKLDKKIEKMKAMMGSTIQKVPAAKPSASKFVDYKGVNGITFFPQKPPYLLTIPIYWEIKLYRLQRLL